MKTDIGVLSENRKKVSELLNVLLADETVLYIKTRKRTKYYQIDNQ